MADTDSTKPTHTKVPNELFELIPTLREAELRVLLFIVRKTHGWHKESDSLSLSQIMEGTGLSRPAVASATESLHERGIVIKTTPEKGTSVYTPRLKGSNPSLPEIVNEVNQQADTSNPSLPDLVNEVNQDSKLSLPEVVNLVNPQKKVKKLTKEKDQEVAADAAPPPPAVVSPPTPPSKPVRARKETPEQTAWFSTLVPVVARVCGLDLNVAGAYAQCKKALQAIEHAKTPPTEALLIELFEAPTGYWFSNFPGNRDGLPPKPHQIPNEWARALAWRPMPYANGNGHQARAAPTKQERTLAALDEYLAEQGYEPPPVVPGVIEGRVIRGNTS